jgi:hypothetical protein
MKDDMSKTSFALTYDGPALANHQMDVRDLAPALLAVGQLFDAANDALNGNATKISVSVKAHEPGCFSVVLEVTQSVLNHGIALLSGDDISAAVNLKDLLIGGGFSAYGLFRLIKHLRGKNPDKMERIGPDLVRIQFGEETFDVPLKLLRLYQDLAVRDAVEKIVEPLDSDGIEMLRIEDTSRKTVLVSVDKADRDSFNTPVYEPKLLISDRRRAAFSIISLAFKEDNKWRLYDGQSQISATIADEDFLHRVDQNIERFSKGDVLVCDVLFEQKQTAKGLVTEHTVEKVIDHKPAPRQLDFLIEESPGGNDESDVDFE